MLRQRNLGELCPSAAVLRPGIFALLALIAPESIRYNEAMSFALTTWPKLSECGNRQQFYDMPLCPILGRRRVGAPMEECGPGKKRSIAEPYPLLGGRMPRLAISWRRVIADWVA